MTDPCRVVGLAALLAIAASPALRAGHSYRRPAQEVVDLQEAWIRHARRLGLDGVLMPVGQRDMPGVVPADRLVRTGTLLAVRDGPPPALAPRAPSPSRVLYHRPFRRRGPDQIPLPGQYFMERWVEAGGAAVSNFRTRELFHFVADRDVPIGDVLFALAWVVGGDDAALWSTAGVLHRARLRGGTRQELREDFLAGFVAAPWRLRPDRRPATEVLALDARAGGFDLLIDEPLAQATLWAGGAARPGAFTVAITHSLPATAARLGDVVGVAADVPATELVPDGLPGSPWSRLGWAPALELLPAGSRASLDRKLWVSLDAARRDHVRAVAAWIARARRPEGSPPGR